MTDKVSEREFKGVLDAIKVNQDFIKVQVGINATTKVKLEVVEENQKIFFKGFLKIAAAVFITFSGFAGVGFYSATAQQQEEPEKPKEKPVLVSVNHE